MNQQPSAPSLAEPIKRRGRPRSPEALTPAQRSKRYRDKKKQESNTPTSASAGKTSINRDVTKNTDPSVGRLEAQLILVNAENIRLSEDLETVHDRVQALSNALAEALRSHASKKPLSVERLRVLTELLVPQTKPFGKKSVTRHKK